MTNQEKKEQLVKLRLVDTRIDYLILEKRRWMERACHITPTLSGMPRGGGDPEKLSSIMDKFAEIEDEIDDRTREYIRLKKRIMRAIHRMPDQTLQELLILRYVHRCSWERISVELDYDFQGKNVYKLHGKALSMLDL